ncbi:hypothetical protein OG455_37110 [Kitasatospora sp. NBC_01287]|uniref:hypothetical protein n=1 Tax=Kitasatospora sp. NBC_01287 TaxID=2903573 RepID=UPI0022595A42|nr:hypothetical protein [Kitasatospora sp. NBC_01287]MCX4751060.1 hypothetical protein [Kitasatospora sp. NBC_01287]
MKRLTAGAATACLAAAAMVGLGAGTAQAAGGCSTTARSNYGATYQVCLYISGSQATVSWTVNASGASTDERVWVSLTSFCPTQSWNWNDWSDGARDNNGGATTSCSAGGFHATMMPTESGRQSGAIVHF